MSVNHQSFINFTSLTVYLVAGIGATNDNNNDDNDNNDDDIE